METRTETNVEVHITLKPSELLDFAAKGELRIRPQGPVEAIKLTDDFEEAVDDEGVPSYMLPQNAAGKLLDREEESLDWESSERGTEDEPHVHVTLDR
jgi:hypothetical protein